MTANNPLVLDTEAMLDIDLGGIKLIEASAGTGKTYTIANLYLRHILAGKIPSEILVVTFTNAATEELRGRIRLRLYQAVQALTTSLEPDDEFLSHLKHQFFHLDLTTQQQQIKRLQFSLRSMDEASISTIHSFCQSVLQNYALPSRQLFESALLADDDSLWQVAVKDWWRRQTYQLDKADWLLVQTSINGFTGFCRSLGEMRSKPSVQFLPKPTGSLVEIFQSYKLLEKNITELATRWQTNRDEIAHILRHSKALSRAAKLPYNGNNIDAFIQRMDDFFTASCLPLPDDFKYLASDVLDESSTKSKRGSDPDLKHNFFLSVNKVNQIFENIHKQLRPQILIEAFEHCSQQVKKLKQGKGLLSYQDQLDLVQEALESSTGEQLATILRKQYPVAMIDEFQDTDSIQYHIFKRLYFGESKTSLTLIGDPKQAIYSFRGGDIFTYMLAKLNPEIQRCSLQTNWRSQTALVEAVNHFFSRRGDSFIYSGSIEFTPALAADKPAEQLLINDCSETALTLWHIPSDENGNPYNKETAGALLNEAVANEIIRLIRGGRNQSICIGDRPLQSGDIAILVRNAYQGESLRRCLEQKGINSVTIGKDKVFDSDEALGLAILLKAIAYNTDRGLLRQALTSALLNFSHLDIAGISDHEFNWQSWCDHFRLLNQIWATRGFIPMFQQCLQTFDLGTRLASRDQAERRLTNLLHLGELLQQQSVRSGGIDNLLNWLYLQMHEADPTEAELRLESDQALVKIVTVHKSKGLEYPVVFLPYLWDCKSVANQNSGILSFHNSKLELVVDLGSDNFDAHRLLADKERLAEDVRLLYVALTRARSKVYLAWGEAGARGRSGNSGQTALAYLLHSKQSADDLDHQVANGITTPENLLDELTEFVESASGNIELKALPLESDYSSFEIEKDTKQLAEVASFTAKHEIAWRINSFSGLTRDIHQVTHSAGISPQGDAILDFPAGSQVGLLLHALFEHMDFESDIADQCRKLLPRHAPRFGLNFEGMLDSLIEWFSQMLHTPLVQPGLSLSVISNAQRLNELSFDFALDQVEAGALNKQLALMSPTPIEPLQIQDFRGLLTGVIDLVFEYQGKFYIADYKSNLLGNRLDDYSADKLEQAMIDRRYDLQSLIYTIALHRYLGQRIRDYDYQQHFGGAYYLFLRAMRRQTGPNCGVHFARPEFNQLMALDRLFAGSGTKV